MLQFSEKIGHGERCLLGPNFFNPKLTQLTHFLSSASLPNYPTEFHINDFIWPCGDYCIFKLKTVQHYHIMLLCILKSNLVNLVTYLWRRLNWNGRSYLIGIQNSSKKISPRSPVKGLFQYHYLCCIYMTLRRGMTFQRLLHFYSVYISTN